MNGGRAKSILVAGHFGFGNAGDEAILAAMVQDLRALQPDVRLRVVSGNTRETEASHAVEALSWVDWEAIISAASASDLVLLGGGGLFHDYWGFDPDTILTPHHAGIAFFSGIPLLATLLDKPLMLYAVGVGPLRSELGRSYTRAVFEQATLATVRDPESRRQLRAIGLAPEGVRVTADPAFHLRIATERAVQLQAAEVARPLLGVALRDWSIDVSPEHWQRQAALALDMFLERFGGSAVFVPFQASDESAQDDAQVAAQVRSQMRYADRTLVLPQPSTPVEKAASLGQCDLVLGMRLHALIFAASYGVPAVGLVYDPKVRSLMAQVGCEEHALDLGALTARRLFELMEDAHQRREALAAQLRESSVELARRAGENARLALSLLESAPQPQAPTSAAFEMLKQVVLSHTQRLAAQQRRLQERERAMVALQAEVARQAGERDRTIAEIQAALREHVRERDQVIGDLKTALDREIGARERVIAELHTALQTQVRERDKVIDELKAAHDREIGARDRVVGDLKAALDSEIGARDKVIGELRGTLDTQVGERERTIAGLNAELQARAAEQSRLAAQAAERAAELLAIHTSRYWRTLSVYWGARERLSAAYYRLRIWLRRALPFRFRHRFVRVARRAGLMAPPRPPYPAARPGPAPASPALPLPPTYDVICFPVVDWEFRYQRPQHLIAQFARHGHRCFYFRTTCHQDGSSVRLEEIADRVFGAQLPGPPELNLYTDPITPEMLRAFMSALDDLRLRAGIVAAVCLVDLPFWAPVALAARERWDWKVVYDCMDEHAGFSTNGRSMLAQERPLLEQCDLVLTSSRRLHEKSAQVAQRVLRLPNAVDFAHFGQPPGADPLAHLARPVIGFYGAISDWFDVEMVRAAAVQRPGWQFVLIGDTFGADMSSLQPLHNVHLLGEKPYAELPAYLYGFDVACIPFLFTRLTLAINPVKFFEYLSAGKPVVAVTLPELEPFQDYFYPVRCADEFVPQVEAALGESSTSKIQARVEFARANTWRQRHETLAAAVRQLYGRAIVVVVSYDNPGYLRLCLESLWFQTVYPNFEVIVVDNGSDPQVAAYLGGAASQEPRLRVIRTGENKGFAAANNLGIAAAGDCDYVVLLNDDTVVTRGWLTGLVRHLQDPDIALVGPVTNCAANEAQVPVDYTSLDRMGAFAERYCRAHEGQAFDIRMLAMYCLGMRRSLLDQIGLLDERFGVGMFEDDDLALRARRAGLRVVCAEDVFVHHWGRASFGRLPQVEYERIFEENRARFEAKWGQRWQPHQARARRNERNASHVDAVV